jgi:hypothetical protein
MSKQKLLESVADIAYMAGNSRYYSGNSRIDISEFIYWAEEFEKKHKHTDWDQEDYLTEIISYTYSKLKKARKLIRDCKSIFPSVK